MTNITTFLDIFARTLVANLGTDRNEKSIVFKLIYQHVSVLMTGDFQGIVSTNKVENNYSFIKSILIKCESIFFIGNIGYK